MVRLVAGIGAVLLVVVAGGVYTYTSMSAKAGSKPAPFRSAEPAAAEAVPLLVPSELAAPVRPPVASPGVSAASAGVPSASAGASSASPRVSASTAKPSPTAAGKRNPTGVNLALGSVATASAVEGDPWLAKNAVDGDASTRWSSGFSEPQWIRLDLKQRWQLTEVRLVWEAAYGVGYRVEASLDGKAWKSIYATTAGKGGTVVVPAAGSARYVRMYGTKRSGSYGFSLLEFEVR